MCSSDLSLTLWLSRFTSTLARVVQVVGLVVILGIAMDVASNASLEEDSESLKETQQLKAQPATPSPNNSVWQNWSAAAVQAELAQGHAVFVDFTAAWCVTCQINKQTTLSQADVLADFADKQVRLMRADWTRRDPAISRALSELGRSGVPVYVLYIPNRPPEVLSELLSAGQVRQALAKVQPKPAS